MIFSRSPVLLENRGALMIVSLLTIILFTLANLPWQLEDYDQAKQAFTSWQMVKSHPVPMAFGTNAPTNGLFYQETPGGKVAAKPPLLGWISTVFYELTRSWDVAWRLPSLASACLLAWLLWRRAAAYFGSLAALIAFAAFSLNLLSPRLATLVRTDMPLALVTFLIALLFFERIRARAPWQARQRASLFLLLTASMLIKGPIVYAFVLPAMILFAWRYRGDALMRSLATKWWPWILSLAIFLVWVIGGVKTVPGFYDEVVMREFAGRFSETFHRPQPLYFYIPHLLHKWAPWSLLLIGLLVADYRSARLPLRTAAATTSKAARVTTPEITPLRRGWLEHWSPEIFWLLAWGIGGFVVMSCIPSKRVDRIFPVVPPLCLLLGAMIDAWYKRLETVPHSPAAKARLARWCAGTLLAAMIFASSYTAFKIVSGFHKHRDALVKCGREFRLRAAENHWRYAVLKSNNEALVLYLDVPGFTGDSEAVQRWSAGKLNTLIGSDRRMRSLLPELENGATTRSDFCKVKGQDRYIIVQRRILP